MDIFAMVQSIKIFSAYFLLIIFIPSFILKNRFINEPLSKRLLIYLVFGNFYVSTLVFILAYLNIFNTLSLGFSIFLMSLLLYLYLNKARVPIRIEEIKQTTKKILLGEYGGFLFLKRTLKKVGTKFHTLYHELFAGNKIEWLLFLAIVGFNLYQYSSNSVDYTTYIAPDEEVHLYWIQSLIGGNIYPSGVYPHVFHTILAALIKLFDFDAMGMIIYFIGTAIFFIMGTLYLGLREIFKSKYAALLSFLLYSILDIYIGSVTYRFQFTIPQEYAMIFLMPLMLFLVHYIKYKKRTDWLFFVFALSMTIGSHFYTGVIALILAFSVGIVYLYRIIKDKIFFKLIIAGVFSVFLALAPLATGLVIGHELEQSFSWGAEVIKGDVYKKTSEGVLKEEGKTDDKMTKKEAPTITLQQFQNGAKLDLEKYLFLEIKTFYILFSILISSFFLNLLLHALKKGDQESEYQLVITVTTLIMLILFLFKALNLPTIMEPKRMAIYIAYFSSIFFGMPLELLGRLLKKVKYKKMFPILAMGTLASSLFLTIEYGRIRPISPLYYFQTTGTTLANWQIMNEYEDLTWTVISPVNNITPIMNRGFHYELSEFILQQENWNKNKEIVIPSEYVFLYIEKRPIVYYGYVFERGDYELKNRPKITRADALKNLSPSMEENFHYKKERNILMAKAYAWAQEFQKYFPKETKIYYEDDELIVYQIKQNTYVLNNFSIDYKINSR